MLRAANKVAVPLRLQSWVMFRNVPSSAEGQAACGPGPGSDSFHRRTVRWRVPIGRTTLGAKGSEQPPKGTLRNSDMSTVRLIAHRLTFHRLPAEIREARFGAGLDESELGRCNPKRFLNSFGALLLEVEPD